MIDVHEHKGVINWVEMKENEPDTRFLIRLGFRGYANKGNIVQDGLFYENMNRSLENGLKVGVYFYSTAIDENEAKEEARFVLKQIKDYNFTLPVVLGYAPHIGARRRNYGTSSEMIEKIENTFMDIIEAAGYKAIVCEPQGIKESNGEQTGLSFDEWCDRYEEKEKDHEPV